MLRALETGKIQAGEFGMGGFRKNTLSSLAGMDVDLSVIKIGGPFDSKPIIKFLD